MFKYALHSYFSSNSTRRLRLDEFWATGTTFLFERPPLLGESKIDTSH